MEELLEEAKEIMKLFLDLDCIRFTSPDDGEDNFHEINHASAKAEVFLKKLENLNK